MSPEAEALLCAKACHWIYGTENDPNGQQSCKQSMLTEGFGDFLWLDIETDFKSLCAFAATSDEYHILAFRGTKNPQDWLTNLNCACVPFEDVFRGTPALGKVHAGFANCLAPELHSLTRMLENRTRPKPLLITGHSLGGALASLAATYFSVRRPSIVTVRRVFTFGQPRVGEEKFCSSYARFVRNKAIRFINDEDIVPRVPLRNQQFADGGTMIHFNSARKPHIDSHEWEDYLKRPFHNMGEILDKLASKVCVADHSMLRYYQLVLTEQPRLTELLGSLCNNNVGDTPLRALELIDPKMI